MRLKYFCVMHLLVRLLGVFLTRRKFVLTVSRYDRGNTPVEVTFSRFPKGNNKIFSPDKYPNYLSIRCNGTRRVIKFGTFVNDLKSTSKSFKKRRHAGLFPVRCHIDFNATSFLVQKPCLSRE